MFTVTLLGLCAGAGVAWLARGTPRAALRAVLPFGLGLAAGLVPRAAGRWAEPYDAYPAQFALARDRSVLAGHATLLLRECLPRLLAGHRLPGYQSDPDPRSLGGSAPLSAGNEATPLAAATTWAALIVGLVSFGALARSGLHARDVPRAGVVWGLVLSSAVVVTGFVANTNIFNADNYRYLATLLVPAALGFGLAARGAWGLGPGGRAAVALVAAASAVLMTADTARWYARLGWVDGRGCPVRAPLVYPALDWLEAHPEVRQVYGGYWDVYRLSFLTGGRVRGKPFPIFPDRFPEWARGRSGVRPEVTVISPGPGSAAFTNDALRDGARYLMRGRGVAVLEWPVRPAARQAEGPES
jgi:hypothetical protein